MQRSAAIFIDFSAISSASNSVCSKSALAADKANSPPEPIPSTPPGISITFPVPSNSIIRSLSMTIKLASRCLKYFSVLQALATFTQALSV